jgi:hypothetical protein
MSKGERVDRIKSTELLHADSGLSPREELLRRLPEINAIYTDELREAVIQTYLLACPDYFWERPSSSSGKYHSVDERGRYGNWIHTKRVFAEYCNIAESWVELGIITPEQKEQGKAVALLHDMMKYGWPSEQNNHTVNNHDLIAADVAQNIGGLPDDVVRVIATHMGPWAAGPEPEEPQELLFHTADKSAAREENDIGIYFPAEELLEEWPELTIAEVEDGESV